MTREYAAIVPSVASIGSPAEFHDDHSGAGTDADLVDLWLRSKRSPLTRVAYAADVAALLAFLGTRQRSLRTTTARDLRDYADALTGKPRTRARRIAAMKSLFSFGARLGYLRFNAAAVIDGPIIPNDLAERIMSTADVRALLAATRGRDRTLIAFLYYSGARIAEAVGLRWLHLHALADGRATVTLHGKGGKTRHVLLPAHVVADLESLRAADDSPVFASDTGRPLHPSNVRKALTAAAKRAGLSRVSPHWLRHAHATHALEKGAPLHVVSSTLGHASVATTSRYLHARPDDSAGLYLERL